MHISKNQMKWIRSLSLKKNRDAEACFLAEGPKVVEDLAGHFPCRFLAMTEEYAASHPFLEAEQIVTLTQRELEQVSQLKTPHDVLAVFRKREEEQEEIFSVPDALVLALDDVQDPGNLGTIIRIADWFGISHIYCSRGCADAYSPKTVMATMGALSRVTIHEVDLVRWMQALPERTPVFGTFLDGEDIYQSDISCGGVLVMGSEGHGISAEIRELVTQKLYIPNFPPDKETSESLNVAVATAIACAEFRRQLR